MNDPIQQAIDLVGLSKLAKSTGVAYQSILGWQKRGRMPRTEWTGETDHAAKIEIATGGAVTRQQLLAWRCQKTKQAA